MQNMWAYSQASFGKRTGSTGRRTSECLILEQSDVIAIDYPEVQLRPAGDRKTLNNIERLLQVDYVRDGGPPHYPQYHSMQYPPDFYPGMYPKAPRDSRGSDTSSAYSGSDTMQSVQSSLEGDGPDLTGLTESNVDSDEEDFLTDGVESLNIRDKVRECLERDPTERSAEDVDTLLSFTQQLQAFTNMTLPVRRALCSVMVFAVVDKKDTVVMSHDEPLDSWSVIINGEVEITSPSGSRQELHMGESFGITPTMEKLYNRGEMRTKVDDCQFLCVTQQDYFNIINKGEENTIKNYDEDGKLCLVTEKRILDGNREEHITIKGTPEQLMSQLVSENSAADHTYVEDFLLTHRSFIKSHTILAEHLLEWFAERNLRDRVTRVVLLWVNNHFTDFELNPRMMDFLEKFESGLDKEKMQGQLRLLNIACAAKARMRTVTLTRPSREEILPFSILRGPEKVGGIYISKVEKGSKAEEVGLKRGDQIHEVNGQSFEHVSHARALEILRGTTHLSITVKSNLLGFKEILNTSEDPLRSRCRKASDIQLVRDSSGPPTIHSQMETGLISSPSKEKKDPAHKGFLTLHKRLRMKDFKMFLPKSLMGGHSDDNLIPQHGGSQGSLSHSLSNPDLTTGFYDDVGSDVPEHSLKVYRADQSCKYLLAHKETTAREIVMLALQEFGITELSNNYSLVEVTVAEGGIIKQRRLPDNLQNLAERMGLSSRYYLKNNSNPSENIFPDELSGELAKELVVQFLQLNAVEVAIQLTLEDFSIFRQIEATEYIDDLFEIQSKATCSKLKQFAELVNRETFWVATEICSESNLVKRMKIMKQFIKIARQCKEYKNFNSMFAIVAGLSHRAVSRLRQTWERLPSKYQKLFSDMQDLMDPSRNMSKYRNLVNGESIQPPVIPFYPVAKKDLTFIHLGNDTYVEEGLINFEKMRMISKEIRNLMSMCNAPFDLFTMLEIGGQPQSTTIVAMNQLNTGGHQVATVKRRKKSTASPNAKKMFEEAQMVRRVKTYLSKMPVISDEDKLWQMSLEVEPVQGSSGVGLGSGLVSGVPTRKRNPSPTLSTASTTSSQSEGKKGTKFGAGSPQSMRKMMSLMEPNKTRPYQPHRPQGMHHSPSPSPGALRRGREPTRGSGPGRPSHERSHSDTPTMPVDLNAESSSVTTLNNLPLRKTHTSGSVTSSDSSSVGSYPHPSYETDSGISTQLDTHSNSSSEVGAGQLAASPPVHQRRYQASSACHSPPLHHRMRSHYLHGVQVLPHPLPPGHIPSHGGYTDQMARIIRQSDYGMSARTRVTHMSRAHSHEGMGMYYSSDVDDEDDEDRQVSAV